MSESEKQPKHTPGTRSAQRAVMSDELNEPTFTAITCSAPTCVKGDHQWDGPNVWRGNMCSISCSKCGVLAYDVDNFMGGW